MSKEGRLCKTKQSVCQIQLSREDSLIDFVTRNIPWTFGEGGFVLDISFVTNKHRFLSTQNLK